MRRPSAPPPAPTKPERWNILWLDNDHQALLDAPHLGEFDAIIFDDRGSAISPQFTNVLPGQAGEVSVAAGAELRQRLEQRSIELMRFLSHGGILVVRLRAPSGIHCYPKGMYDLYPRTETIRFSDWWTRAVSRLSVLAQVEKEAVLAAAGDRVFVEEPDHCFEPYLLAARYTAVLDRLVFADKKDHPQKLATNPVGDVVACEDDFGNGTVLIVPADGNDEILQTCLENLLILRKSHTQSWRVPEELELLDRFRQATERLREERAIVLKGLSEVWSRKQRVFEDVDVRRVLSRLEKATSASTSSKDSLIPLYNLVEIIEGRMGGEAALMNVLGVPKATINSVKRPANEERFDVRHSTSGEPDTLEADAVEGALKAASAIVQAFVTHLYEQTGEVKDSP